jgi:hypothetical protein
MFRVSHDSPLKKPPAQISERQIVLLDGIRYSADMAAIALDRLWLKLCNIDQNNETTTSADIAEAVLDAWSIVDASHRTVDLIEAMPGLTNEPWKRIFRNRMADALVLRDAWQHQDGEVETTVRMRGQAWGALAWMQHNGQKPTGRWFLTVAGTEFKGSSWVFVGPNKTIPREDTRRIRLLHGKRKFYLARAVRDIFEMLGHLEATIIAGKLRLVGAAVNQQRCNDTVSATEMVISYTVAEPIVK